mgnify:CR=1 FL=1
MLTSLWKSANQMAPKRKNKQEQDLQHVRSQLRLLEKHWRRCSKDLIWSVPEQVQKIAVSIQLLCEDSRWAIAWVQKWQLRHYTQAIGCAVRPTHAMILVWVEKHKSDSELLVILENIDHPKRRVVDTFLMESLLYEFVQENSLKGIAIPTAALIAKHLTNWSCRPVSSLVAVDLLELQQNKSKRTQWARRFRHRWNILWGMINKDKPQSRDLLQRKAINF